MDKIKQVVLVTVIFLFAIGLWRTFNLVFHDPVYALANSYDMIRLQACHNISPSQKEFRDGSGTPDAPLSKYIVAKKPVGDCFLSSESVFVWAGLIGVKAKALLGGGKSFDIRIMGTVRSFILFLLAGILSFIFFRYKLYLPALINAIFYALILSDPAVTLYANTFYTEFSTVFGLYLSLSMLYLYTLKPNFSYLLFAAAGLGILGLSKPQHMLLPAVIVAVWAGTHLILKKKISLRPVSLLIICCAFVLGIQGYLRTLDRNFNINRANATNTFLYTFLPYAENPSAALKAVGLPESCKIAIGNNFLSILKFSEHPCPEIIGASRTGLLKYLTQEPLIFYRVSEKSVENLRPWIPTLYGHIENTHYKFINEFVFTVDDWINALPVQWFVFLVFGGLLAGSLAVFYRLKKSDVSGVFVFLAIMLSIFETFFVSLFGDGFSDFSKHNHITTLLLACLYIILFSTLLWFGIKFSARKFKARFDGWS